MTPTREAGTVRNCIKCSTVFQRRSFDGVEVDSCPACGGLWLDAGELQALARKPQQAAQSLHHLPSVHKTADGDDASKPCPACGGKLAIASFEGVSLEHCSSCDGLFVDRGELENAMAIFSTEDAARTIVSIAVSVVRQGSIG